MGGGKHEEEIGKYRRVYQRRVRVCRSQSLSNKDYIIKIMIDTGEAEERGDTGVEEMSMIFSWEGSSLMLIAGAEARRGDRSVDAITCTHSHTRTLERRDRE